MPRPILSVLRPAKGKPFKLPNEKRRRVSFLTNRAKGAGVVTRIFAGPFLKRASLAPKFSDAIVAASKKTNTPHYGLTVRPTKNPKNK